VAATSNVREPAGAHAPIAGVLSGSRGSCPPSTERCARPAAPLPILDRPLRILLADDSPDNRLLVRAYLREAPYLLDNAENGREAIERFTSTAYDLVLMDIQMPEVDGYAATRAIRQWERDHGRPRTPIVALTASAVDDAVRGTREAGCDAHVTKPVKKPLCSRRFAMR
jgi:CheY-like chemotaxis protein